MSTLAACKEYLASPRLQPRVAVDALVPVNAVAWANHRRRTDMNTNGSISKKLESERLAKAVAAALERRVGQGKAMLPKQLAHCLQRSEQTVWGWMAGVRPPSGPDLIALINFFDASFANEILDGCVVHKLCDHRRLHEAKEKIADAIEAIAWLKEGGQ